MAKGKRSVPDINSSSTADIAFLLLIFFLLTTSMDTDRGLARRLPPPPEKDAKVDDEVTVKERNVLQILLNKNDQLMCNGEQITVKELRERAKEFIANPTDDPNMPEKHPKNIPGLGDVMVTDKHVISLQNDRGTTYSEYIKVQNELVAAYNELRDELSQEKWGKNYSELDESRQEAVRDFYPQRISEAEPKNYGDKK
ncbi:MAG TPA: biopolymer transporter ExbD [Candidatus Avibacteroides excrementipullorum]|nr:biopolymer transporter ExbD [Candidatus Avibacteroides excrementipullorum]